MALNLLAIDRGTAIKMMMATQKMITNTTNTTTNTTSEAFLACRWKGCTVWSVRCVKLFEFDQVRSYTTCVNMMRNHSLMQMSSSYSLVSSCSISVCTISSTWGRDTVCHAPTHSGGNLSLQYTNIRDNTVEKRHDINSM